MTFAPSTDDEATVVTVDPSEPLAQQTVLRILTAVPPDEYATIRELAADGGVPAQTIYRYTDVLDDVCEQRTVLSDRRRRCSAYRRPFDAVRIEL